MDNTTKKGIPQKLVVSAFITAEKKRTHSKRTPFGLGNKTQLNQHNNRFSGGNYGDSCD